MQSEFSSSSLSLYSKFKCCIPKLAGFVKSQTSPVKNKLIVLWKMNDPYFFQFLITSETPVTFFFGSSIKQKSPWLQNHSILNFRFPLQLNLNLLFLCFYVSIPKIRKMLLFVCTGIPVGDYCVWFVSFDKRRTKNAADTKNLKTGS